MSDTLVLLVTVPTVTALIGYVTNWAAIKMMFYPSEPKGIGPLKWQGIVYRMSGKFAAEISATTSQVLSPHDIVERLDIDGLMRRLLETHPDEVDRLFEAAFEEVAPGMWAQTVPEAKQQLQAMLLSQVGAQTETAMEAFGPRLPEILDLDTLVVTELTGPNSERLARVAKEICAKEMRFVEIYGGVFGFIVGLVQVALFGIFGIWWTMPIVGGIVGLGTNWLAIQMIFRPLEPKKFFGFVRYQGMFPKRQPEIAADYGRLAQHEIFTPDKLIDALVGGPGFTLLLDDLKVLAAQQLGTFRPMLSGLTGGAEVTDDDINSVVATIEREALLLLPAVQPVVEEHLAGSLQVGSLIEERLSVLDKAQFERMLRGIFEEDEWILIVVGGALGAAIGTLQGVMVLLLDL